MKHSEFQNNTTILDQELTYEDLENISGSWGVVTPVVAAFALGYGAGTVFGKATGLIS